MKKLLTILAMVAATSAMADSVTLSRQSNDVLDSNKDQTQYSLSYKHDFNKTFAGDVQFSNTQTDVTNSLGTRLEAGLTANTPLFGSVKGYVRTALGQRYSNGKDYQYYSIEPGLTTNVGPFNVKIGYRLRDATDSKVNSSEDTRTKRLKISYPLSKNDAIAIGFDRERGDANKNGTSISYTRSF